MGAVAVVKLLLATEGVNPDSSSDSGRTPLSFASGMGGVGVVKLLLSTDRVDPDSKDCDGRAPLFWANKGLVNAQR